MKKKASLALAPSHGLITADHYDALAALFTAILMQLQAALDLPIGNTEVRRDCFLRAENLARQGLREVRELVEMGTLMDDPHEGALIAMRTLVAAVPRKSAAVCQFQVKGEECPLKISVGIALQRVLREALTNAHRHADAKSIVIQFCFEDDRVILEIKDDGCGFRPDDCLSNGFGLMTMRTRVGRLGGCLWLRSSPGKGTHIRVDLPNPYPAG